MATDSERYVENRAFRRSLGLPEVIEDDDVWERYANLLTRRTPRRPSPDETDPTSSSSHA